MPILKTFNVLFLIAIIERLAAFMEDASQISMLPSLFEKASFVSAALGEHPE